MPYRAAENTEPIVANCASHATSTSALAPASSKIVGVDPGTGIGVAIAGRFTPSMRPMRNSAEAIVAPVLPAEIIALAFPSRTASALRTRVESFFARTAPAGSSSMPITSLATSNSRSAMSARAPRSAGPTSITGIPSAAACLAPATISPGALSPPMASTAIGFMMRNSH